MNSARQFAPQALRDVEDAADWLASAQGGPLLARRFATAVIEAAERIERRPLLGHRRPELLPDPFRFRRVTGFPYLLVYDAKRPVPVILRVLHMARELGPLLADLTTTFDPDPEQPE